MKLILPLIVILSVVGITLLFVWLRYEKIAAQPKAVSASASAGTVSKKSAEQIPRQLFVFAFSMAAFLFGIATAIAFYVATGWWTSARSILFYIALGLTVLLSIAAAIVRTRVIHSGAIECVALNLAWGLGYGWLLPLVMTWMNLVRR
jgi:hypothetical protein